MGIDGLWPWTKQRGYVPSELILGFTRLPSGVNRRVDLAGAFYPTIRWAYGSNILDDAHAVVEGQLKRLGEKDDIIVYIDGAAPEEKQATHLERAERQSRALDMAKRDLDLLDQQISSGQRITKHQFSTVEKHVTNSFSWDPEAKDSLAKYLRKNGWHVVECETEADVEIARDCGPEDIVVTRDSDFLAYATVSTIWQLIGKGRVLEYSVESLLTDVKLSRTQLTVLCIVSQNDYSKNLYGLGPQTNYKIVKALTSQDVPNMVLAYLGDDRVVRANTARQEDFQAALNVFHHRRQTRRSATASPDIGTRINSSNDKSCTPTPSTEPDISMTVDVDPACPLLPEPDGCPAERPTPDPTSAITTPTFRSMRERFDLLREQVQLRKRQFWESKLCSDKGYNRYRTPPPRHGKPADGKPVKHRPPYVFKSRTQRIEHDLPEAMVQLKRKEYKEPPRLVKPSTPPKKKISIRKPMTGRTNKKSLLNQLTFEHPTVSLSIGTLQGKVNEVLTGTPELRNDVIDCIRIAVQLAWAVKLRCQEVIGRYLEMIFSGGCQAGPTDRTFLDALCERLPAKAKDADDKKKNADNKEKDADNNERDADNNEKEEANEENEENEDDEEREEDEDEQTDLGAKGGEQLRFLIAFTTFLYSGTRPLMRGDVSILVNGFITRLEGLGLLGKEPISRSSLCGHEYPASSIARTVAVQIKAELKRHYHYGCKMLVEKIRKQQELGVLPKDPPLETDPDVSCIETFVKVNRLAQSPRKLSPLSQVRTGYLTFSEPELASFFWKRMHLRAKLQEIAAPYFNNPPARGLPLIDIQESLPVGLVIKTLMADVDPQGLSSRQRTKKCVLAATRLWSTQATVDHINSLRTSTFDPSTYSTKGYLLRGSVRTDGHQLQILSFKLRELQSVRFRRYPEAKLPPRLTSSVGGIDYFLSEIRNVVKSPDDVLKIFGCLANQIKILALDLGQACVVGSSLLLPDSDPAGEETFHNQAVKTKAVLQPIFKMRRWMQDQKTRPLDGADQGSGASGQNMPRSIAEVESRMPPLRHRSKYNQQLDDFYNKGFRFKKHTWDASRAKQEEYNKIANALLKSVGGNIGTKRAEDNHVIIAVGLSKFQTKTGLSSLDGTFGRYFLRGQPANCGTHLVFKARSLGYIVVGVNEYYTSQKCPRCQDFIGRITYRRLHCRRCKRRYHRDAMAAANMCNIVRSHLDGQGRPKYLQPMRTDGTFPWEDRGRPSSGGDALATRPKRKAGPAGTDRGTKRLTRGGGGSSGGEMSSH
ncbi:Elongation of fatty acids protein 2 [Actinomortierella ambigua]|nr:Elongation of fatty acids protein 2 [Actinomortierella ambigua]